MVTLSEENNIIYITGFGPFYGHEKSNASWEAVRLLPDTYTFNDKIYIIKKLEIPVIYNEIDKILPTIWDSNPKVLLIVLYYFFSFSCMYVVYLLQNIPINLLYIIMFIFIAVKDGKSQICFF